MLHVFPLKKELLCLDKLMLCPRSELLGLMPQQFRPHAPTTAALKAAWSPLHTVTHQHPKDPKAPEEPAHTPSSAKETGDKQNCSRPWIQQEANSNPEYIFISMYCTEDLYTLILAHQALLQRGLGPSSEQELSTFIIPPHVYF